MKRGRIIFNALTLVFEPYLDQEFYLTVKRDRLREDKAEVVFLVDTAYKGEDGNLALNNDDEANTLASVARFKNRDPRFMLELDFYAQDNPHRLAQAGLRPYADQTDAVNHTLYSQTA